MTLKKQVWPPIPQPEPASFPWVVTMTILVAVFLAIAIHQITVWVDRVRETERRVEALESANAHCRMLWPSEVEP